MAPRRKRWTEEEERSLFDKYAGMAADGSFSCLRSRERRFRPVAAHVNASHHAVDPAAYPFLWTWKDAATKVHNMRHQYLLVKRKLLALDPPHSAAVDWSEQRGVSHWPNFLFYRSVFGDAPLPDPAPGGVFDNDCELGLGLGIDSESEGGDEGADREVEEDEGFDCNEVVPIAAEPPPPPAADMSSMKAINATRAEMRLREWEAWMEERDEERESARKERKKAALEAEEEREQRRRQARHQWREEELEWEERMDGRMQEWKKRVEGMLREHRADMEGIQARILHEQQSLIEQLLGVLSQWPPSPVFGGFSDGGGSSTALGNRHHHHQAHSQPVPYLSQMMQGLHHVTGVVPGEHRADGDGPDDHFMVDD